MRVPSSAPAQLPHQLACLGCGSPADPARRGLCVPCWDGQIAEAVRAGLPLLEGAGARIASRLDFAGPVGDDPALGSCWVSTGARNSRGYAVARVDGRVEYLHRWAVQSIYGRIPDGFEPDHRCHDWRVCSLGVICPQRACLRPSHLMLVTKAQNRARSASPPATNARKDRCIRGHKLAGQNLYRHPQRGTRHCRLCQAISDSGRRRAA